MNTGILYSYVNLPQSWYGIGADRLDISPIRFSKILDGFSKLPDRPISILCIGQVAPIVNNLIEVFGINDVFGVDFIEYFASTFTPETKDVPFRKFVIIYNIGYEKALNKDFSKQILQGLIKRCIDNKCYVLLQTDLQLSKVRSDYEVSTVNVIQLPELSEPKVF